MKHLFTLLLFAYSPFLLSAQPAAPDFTVTDSNGQEHQLYADYLDLGKTVVLKIFFTTCPPCNAMAPLLEPFYQEWGGGEAGVEFISLSDKNYDTNVAVAEYKAMHGHTFPGAGSDGGSLQAVAPYKNGTYGLFLGTPTFVVIAPDGTVDFDPRGPNFEATLDSVDMAIRNTGAEKPPVLYEVFGMVQSVQDSAIAGVQISIEEADTTSGLSNNSGEYIFTALLIPRDFYHLTAAKDTSYTNGVTIRDLIMIREHILGTDTLHSPLQLLAADADHSGHITNMDIIQLLKIILHIDEDLDDNDSWIFLDPDYQFADPLDPFPDVYNGQASRQRFRTFDDPPFNWRGVKIGDVNFSADPKE
jgi:thiol-disulfide isomerase/thioredoxin